MAQHIFATTLRPGDRPVDLTLDRLGVFGEGFSNLRSSGCSNLGRAGQIARCLAQFGGNPFSLRGGRAPQHLERVSFGAKRFAQRTALRISLIAGIGQFGSVAPQPCAHFFDLFEIRTRHFGESIGLCTQAICHHINLKAG